MSEGLRPSGSPVRVLRRAATEGEVARHLIAGSAGWHPSGVRPKIGSPIPVVASADGRNRHYLLHLSGVRTNLGANQLSEPDTGGGGRRRPKSPATLLHPLRGAEDPAIPLSGPGGSQRVAGGRGRPRPTPPVEEPHPFRTP